jgi:hypothetical protein
MYALLCDTNVVLVLLPTTIIYLYIDVFGYILVLDTSILAISNSGETA